MASITRSRIARLIGIPLLLLVFNGLAIPASAAPVFSLTETPFPIGAQYSGTPPGSGLDFVSVLQLIDPVLTYSSVVETALVGATRYDFNATLTATDPVLGLFTFTGTGIALKHSGSSPFATELLALTLTGPPDPFGLSGLLRESPTLPSLGQLTTTPQGGGFNVESFFDVFAEISLDGGVNWIPSTSNTRIALGEPVASVPEPGTLWLLATGALGLARSTRRRRRLMN